MLCPYTTVSYTGVLDHFPCDKAQHLLPLYLSRKAARPFVFRGPHRSDPEGRLTPKLDTRSLDLSLGFHPSLRPDTLLVHRRLRAGGEVCSTAYREVYRPESLPSITTPLDQSCSRNTQHLTTHNRGSSTDGFYLFHSRGLQYGRSQLHGYGALSPR